MMIRVLWFLSVTIVLAALGCAGDSVDPALAGGAGGSWSCEAQDACAPSGACPDGDCAPPECGNDCDDPPPVDDGPRAFPGARGFGTDSPCGRGGQIFVVRTQSDLDACLLDTGPRICVFEVSGTFSAPSIVSPFLTIAGQTAPSPGIQIAPRLDVRTHDVCVLHLRVRGDGSVGDPIHLNHRQENGEEQTYNLVFDHISVSWGTDENFSSYCGPGNAVDGAPGTPDGYVRDVTLSHSISSEGLADHSMGMLAARPGHERFSVLSSVFASNNSRNPKLGNGQFVIANNLIYNHGNRGIRLGSSGGVFDGYIVGNDLVDGPSTSASAWPISGASGNDATNQLHVADNAQGGVVGAEPATLVMWDGPNLSFVPTQDWVDALDLQLTPASDVRARRVACAGARPLDRDPVDARIISEIETGGGAMISSAPPLPNLDGGSHELSALLRSTDPADWARDSDGDGYTDVDDELHAMSVALECETMWARRHPLTGARSPSTSASARAHSRASAGAPRDRAPRSSRRAPPDPRPAAAPAP